MATIVLGVRRYSAFHVCSPSRAAMMTGRLSVRAGIGFVGAGSNGVFTAESVGCLPANETSTPGRSFRFCLC